MNDAGNTIGGNWRNLENMATSMGMYNVAYYSSDRPMLNGAPSYKASLPGIESIQTPLMSTPCLSLPTFPKAVFIALIDGINAIVDDNNETNNGSNEDDTLVNRIALKISKMSFGL